MKIAISKFKDTMGKKWSWELNVNTTGPALQRLAGGLIATRSALSDSSVIWHELGRGISATVMVQIPEGQEMRFREIVKPYSMDPPRLVQIGMNNQPDDGHPGRRNIRESS